MIASDVFLEYIVPWAGVIIGNLMFAAPWKDVLHASQTGELGDLNPLPWTFMTGVCYGWTFYGTMSQKLPLLMGAAPGLLISIWLNMQAVKLLYARSYSTEMRKTLQEDAERKREEARKPKRTASLKRGNSFRLSRLSRRLRPSHASTSSVKSMKSNRSLRKIVLSKDAFQNSNGQSLFHKSGDNLFHKSGDHLFYKSGNNISTTTTNGENYQNSIANLKYDLRNDPIKENKVEESENETEHEIDFASGKRFRIDGDDGDDGSIQQSAEHSKLFHDSSDSMDFNGTNKNDSVNEEEYTVNVSGRMQNDEKSDEFLPVRRIRKNSDDGSVQRNQLINNNKSNVKVEFVSDRPKVVRKNSDDGSIQLSQLYDKSNTKIDFVPDRPRVVRKNSDDGSIQLSQLYDKSTTTIIFESTRPDTADEVNKDNNNNNNNNNNADAEFDDDDDGFDMIVLNVHTKLQKIKTSATQEIILLVIITLWLAVTLILSFTDSLSTDTKLSIIGIIVNVNFVIFYGAPLSTIYTVIQTEATATIHVPTMLLNTFNGLFWGVYGAAIGDVFVILPNGIGVLLGVIQIGLCLYYPRYPKGIDLTEERTMILMTPLTRSESKRFQQSVMCRSSRGLMEDSEFQLLFNEMSKSTVTGMGGINF